MIKSKFMLCPNCKKEMVAEEIETSDDKKIYKLYQVGINPDDIKTYCSLCIDKKSKKK